MKKFLLFTWALFACILPYKSYSQSSPDLGTTSGFAFFTAAGAFTVTGASVVRGDVGTHAGAYAAFPPGVLIGNAHVANTVTAQAAIDVIVAYSQLSSQTCNNVIGVTLGNGQILTPGLYCTGAQSTLNGNLFLDGEGDANAIFIIQIDGAFVSNTLSTITLINGASICNVYFQINGAVELGVDSEFRGNIIASGAISLYSGASIEGKALTTAGAISLSDNMASICSASFLITCPADISVTCQNEVPAPDLTNLLVEGNCGPDPVFTVDPDVIQNFICAGNYSISRIYRASNECGDEVTCEQIITVLDDVAPVLTCIPDITVLCVSDVPVPNPGAITATDNCGTTGAITALDDVISNIICDNQFTISRIYTTTDDCGNVGTCVQTITVIDDELPTITCPGDLQFTCTEEVPAADITLVTGADGCGGAVTITVASDVVSNFICDNNYTIVRVYIASDICGNLATCEQTITILDNVSPTITCPGDLQFTCTDEVPPADITLVTGTDGCGGDVTITVATDVVSNFICDNNYTITRMYTATDDCGNMATCAQVITILDAIIPSIICPDDLTLTCAGDAPDPNTNISFISDNCGGILDVTVAPDVLTGTSCATGFAILRVYTVTDVCGNTGTCAQNMFILDDIAPTIVCPPTASVTCGLDFPVPGVGVITNDNCAGLIELTFDQTANNGAECEVMRTYTATDLCGNTATCEQIIIVIDNVAPVITCPVTLTVGCVGDVPLADISAVTVTDACDPAVIVTMAPDVISNLTCENGFTITRLFTATDACGNSSTCIQTIIVNDEQVPVISFCPPAIEIACGAELPVAEIELLIATDNCTASGDLLVFSTDVFLGGNGCGLSPAITSRMYTVQDACGNEATCVQLISMTDDEAPVITSCPSEVNISCVSDLVAGNVQLIVASDNCTMAEDLLITFADIDNGGTGCITDPLIIQRTYVVSDICGNTATCAQILNVVDNVAPVILNCPAQVTITCIDDLSPGNTELITVTDNCAMNSAPIIEVLDISNNGTGCATDPLIINRTFTVSDACGNSSVCVQVITLIDNVAPVIQNCPADLLLTCLEDVPAGEELTAIADCSNVVITLAETNNGGTACLSDPLIITRIYTSTDACGNTSACTQLITILNESIPVIENCPSNLQFDCLADLPAPVLVTATGICGEAVVSMAESNNGGTGCASNPLIITRTYTATDICGNTSVCLQTITIVDNILPVIQNCPPNLQFVCIEDVPVANVNLILATDNCSVINVSFMESNNGGSGCESDPLILTRIYTVSDACGNTTSCDQLITIIDDEAPVITVQHPTLGILSNGEIITVQCESNNPGWNVEALLEGMAEVTDNCSQDASVVFTVIANHSGDCEAEGYLIQMDYQWVASDICGNTASFSVSIQVVDTIAPVLIGIPEDITVSCDAIPEKAICSPCGTSAQAWSQNIIVLDECECAEVTFEEIIIEGDCETANVILRIWTGIDNCGNTVRDTQTVTVINDSGPEFIWATDITGNIANGGILEVECFEGGLPAWVYDLDFRSMHAIDACQSNEDLRVTFDYAFMGFGDCIADGYVQAYEFVWTATSTCGVLGEYRIQIRLIDTTAPIIENWQELVCIGPFDENNWIVIESCTGVTFDVTENNVASTCYPGQQDILRTLVLTDGCNNSTVYLQTVASSNEGPVFEWRSETFNAENGDTIQLECDFLGANNHSGISKQDLSVSANCTSILNVDFKEELLYLGDCDGFLKTVKLTWTATDECLQISVFELTVNIVDHTAPVIHAEERITVMCGQAIPAPFVTDCSDVSVRLEELSRTFSDCPDYMTIQRNIIAVDECGNEMSMKQEVIMTNMGVDMFEGIDEVICITEMPIPVLPVFVDPCTGEEMIPEVSMENMQDDCGLPGTMRRRITLINDCGMVSQMDQIILMRTQLTPELLIAHPELGVIKDKTVFELECGDEEIEFTLRQARLMNSCPGDEIRFEINEIYSTDCKTDGFISRLEYKWTANDVCENETVFTIYVNFNDTQAPVFTNVPVDLQVICEDLPEVIAPDVIDLCTEVELTFSETRVDRNEAVYITRTWIAEDECGNIATVSQEIEMISNWDFDCNIELLDSIICNGDSIRFTTNIDGPYDYFWEVEGGACVITGGQGTPTIIVSVGFSAVTVRLRIINENGCLIECEQTFICETDLSFSGLLNGTSNILVTELFPNPAAHEVNLKYSAEKAATGNIRVFDILGRTHFVKNVDILKGNHLLQIPLDRLLSTGFYFIELESDNVVKTYRFLKE